MKKIALSDNSKHGQLYTLVDDWLYDELNQYKWCVSQTHKTAFYVVRFVAKKDGVQIQQRMHILIMQLLGLYEEGKKIDHKNGNGLDNREENLRLVTNRQNLQNLRANTTGFPGVSYFSPTKNYRACIRIGEDQRNKHLGCYDTKQDAYAAYYIYNVLELGTIPIPLETHQNNLSEQDKILLEETGIQQYLIREATQRRLSR
jgi:HNH endonuclease